MIMKAITSTKELKGKTIKSASEVDCCESVVLLFTDGSYAFFDIRHYGESYDMFLSSEASDYLKRDAGIITEDEYNKIKEDENKLREERVKNQELQQLERLKSKYEKAN